MDWDKFNEETKPAMNFFRKVYHDNPYELLSLECAHAEEDLDVIIDSLVKFENWLEYEVATLRSLKKSMDSNI